VIGRAPSRFAIAEGRSHHHLRVVAHASFTLDDEIGIVRPNERTTMFRFLVVPIFVCAMLGCDSVYVVGHSPDGSMADARSSFDAEKDGSTSDEDGGVVPVLDGGDRNDASWMDAGRVDGGITDAGTNDAAMADAGPDDASIVDAGGGELIDAVVIGTDAGVLDAGWTSDAAHADAGSTGTSECGDGFQADAPWPTWNRCGSRQGNSPTRGPASVGSSWSRTIEGGQGRAPAVAADGTIYVSGTRLHAFEPDGSPRWFFGAASSPSSASIGADGTIYIGSNEGVFAIWPDGRERWRNESTGDVNTAPIIGADGTVFVTGETRVIALDDVGAQKRSIDSLFQPSALAMSDGVLYFTTAHTFHAVRTSGVGIWSFPNPIADAYFISSPAVGDDGTIYVATHRALLAVGRNGIERWRAPLAGYSGEITIAPNGDIHVLSGGGRTWHVIPASGPPGMSRPIADNLWSAPIIDAEGTAYSFEGGSLASRVHAVRADGSTLWSHSITGGCSSQRGHLAMGPDGTIYVSFCSTLMALLP
jgi:hypothetical protein